MNMNTNGSINKKNTRFCLNIIHCWC